MKHLKYVIPSVILFAVGIVLGRLTVPEKTSANQDISSKRSGLTSENSGFQNQDNISSARTRVGGEIFSMAFSKKSHKDLAQMARLAADSADDIDNSSLLQALISEWAKQDPIAALAFAKEQDRSDLLFIGLRSLGASDYEGAMDWLQNNVTDLTMHGHLLAGIFQGVAKTDPSRAVEMANQLTNAFHKDQILSVTLDEWAKQDINGVFEWLETTEFSQQFPHHYDQVITRYINDSPREAADLVNKMEAGTSKANFALNLAYELAKEDTSEAIKWAESLTGSEKGFAIQGALESWASQEAGMEALDYAIQQNEATDYESIIGKVMMQLTKSNPEKLQQRLSSLPKKEQGIAAQHLSRLYSVNNPETALTWIDSIESPDTRDAAIVGGLINFKHHDISQAFSLSKTISNNNTRLQKVESVIREWYENDAAVAEQALYDAVEITQQEKDKIKNSVLNQVQPRNYFLVPESKN